MASTEVDLGETFLSSGQKHARLIPSFRSQEEWHWPSELLRAARAGSCSALCQADGQLTF